MGVVESLKGKCVREGVPRPAGVKQRAVLYLTTDFSEY